MTGHGKNGGGFCVWFTGLSGAGKSTIAEALRPRLERFGHAVEVLDGDEVRKTLSKGLGFSREDRDANVLRIAFVAGAVVRAGGVAITCAISPYREVRDKARAGIPRFVEVHVAAPLEECIRRDPKGLYKKALAGEIPQFTGVSDPYEPPLRPEIVVPTHTQSLEQSVDLIVSRLREMGLLPGGRIRPHGGQLVDRVATGARRDQALEWARHLPHLEVTEETADDAWNIAHGVYSPLEGFLCESDFWSVLDHRRLVNGNWWTIPIVLDVTARDAARIGPRVVLTRAGEPVALMTVQSAYEPDRGAFVRSVFGTSDPAHPGVARVGAMGEVFLGGEIEWIGAGTGPLSRHRMTPKETRALFDARGFKTVAAFQTRNVPHLGHEHLQRLALNACDGLFVNPVIGKKKAGDFKDDVIIAAYETLVRGFYPHERVVLSTLHMAMRYAGPIEAIHHAIIRKNFGCTDIIIGRDHAGVGSYYSPFAAQEIFDDFPGLDIRPLKYPESFFCTTCDGMATTRDCPHDAAARQTVSATQIRAALRGEGGSLRHRMRDEVLDAIRQFEAPIVGEAPPAKGTGTPALA